MAAAEQGSHPRSVGRATSLFQRNCRTKANLFHSTLSSASPLQLGFAHHSNSAIYILIRLTKECDIDRIGKNRLALSIMHGYVGYNRRGALNSDYCVLTITVIALRNKRDGFARCKRYI